MENVIIGMPHRGRLNALYSVLKKPADNILGEFQDINGIQFDEENWGNSGDVKYHLGTTHDKQYGDHTIRLVKRNWEEGFGLVFSIKNEDKY